MKVQRPSKKSIFLILGALALVVWAACKCDFRRPFDKEMSVRFQRTIQNNDPLVISNIIERFMSTNKESLDYSTNIPPEISQLPIFELDPNSIDIWEFGSHGAPGHYLMFVQGSGFGHWGLIFAPDAESLKAAKACDPHSLTPWKDGLIFYVGN